jgi:predicted O-methyltransferase YrrM
MDDEIQALLSENEQLRRENSLLRERVDAFERSRWWRLHPRLALRRRRQEEHASGVESDTEPAQAPVDDSAVERFRDDVVSRGSFTDDWFTHHIPHLHPLLESLSERQSRVLEIGSYEGLSCCYFLWRLPEARITCVDTFRGPLEGEHRERDRLEETFDRNVALVDASRVRKIVGDSRRVLLDLAEDGGSFDLVYVDGSHLGLDVLTDGALSWRLLDAGGTMIFDDYSWHRIGDDPLLRPGPAIDALLKVLDDKYELLHRGEQLAVQKTV